MGRAPWLGVLLALIALALGGCGDDDEGSSGSTVTAAASRS